MVTTLTGSNYYSLRKRFDELISEFVKKHGELALERIEAEQASPQDIIDTISNLPFLVSEKLVVIRDLGSNAKAATQLEQIISSAGDTTSVIIYDPTIDKRTAYFKELKRLTKLEEFVELDSRTLVAWVLEETKNQGGEITRNDANLLVERLGPNQTLIANELNKLITFNPEISQASIELLTEPTLQSRVFDLLDAAFDGNKESALRLYDEQRAQKVEAQAILALITWQLNILAIAKFGAGKQPAVMAKDFNLSPYPLAKASRLTRRLSEPKLKMLVTDAFEIDLKSKTKSIDLDEALKTYIATI